eukprot:TRINITY_DN2739_c0_g1_i2.p1 TRINITY_DN2739_c0_g1~~TRINITY_DN2739_c0_g1_i2.p1  ORF type:complete len:391 (+),score=90.02 TRINITY_DN2739_c0_g1_i2:509-1681(+)
MKDMYSFDRTKEAAFETYEQVKSAYRRVFDRLEAKYAIADADSGKIGGDKSHEFHLLSDAGEDTLLSCSKCGTAANVEKSVRHLHDLPTNHNTMSLKDIANLKGIEAHFLKAYASEKPFKNIIVFTKDRHPNHTKIQSKLGHDDVQDASLDKMDESLGLSILIDHSVFESPSTDAPSSLTDVTRQKILDLASNSKSHHLTGDFHNVKHGDHCSHCQSSLQQTRGIEVGHVFYLGTKYSVPLDAVQPNHTGGFDPFEMGCYGMGVSRILAGIIEAQHDQHGIRYPECIAPYRAIVIPLGTDKNPKIQDDADQLYRDLWNSHLKNDLVMEDRTHHHPGYRMNDARFLGFPYAIVMGRDYKDNGRFEVQIRRSGEKLSLNRDQLFNLFSHGTK